MRQILCVSFVIACIATCTLAGPIKEGFTAYFANAGCPEGWESVASAEGRLIVAVHDASQGGITVGSPLSDQEDRTHVHPYSTTYTLPEKDIAAIADDNTQGAHHGTFPISGMLQAHTTGYPFTQLPFCRYRGGSAAIVGNGTNTTVPTTSFGNVAFFTEEVSNCPTGWVPKQDFTGRIIVPGYAEGGPQSNAASALSSGEDRNHNHTFSVGFTTTDVSFEGVDGCCNDQPAKTGDVVIAGTSAEGSSGLPYVQMLTCVNQETTFSAAMPPGALLFHELECPPGWSLVDTINGRLLVSLVNGGSPGASFGGDSLSSLHPKNPQHHHIVNGSVSLASASVLLGSGCCGSGYAGTNTYLFSGPSDENTVELPFTMIPMCQQETDRSRNQAFFNPRV